MDSLYTHLHAQLAQLNAHLADTENLLRMTSLQAQDMRFLGGYVGALFVGAGRVLGEESVRGREGGGMSCSWDQPVERSMIGQYLWLRLDPTGSCCED